MGIFFSVILSEAKDLMPVASGDEILRFAQDDNGRHLQPTTKVSATKVLPRRQWPGVHPMIGGPGENVENAENLMLATLK
jgi:hypothetical protein